MLSFLIKALYFFLFFLMCGEKQICTKKCTTIALRYVPKKPDESYLMHFNMSFKNMAKRDKPLLHNFHSKCSVPQPIYSIILKSLLPAIKSNICVANCGQ